MFWPFANAHCLVTQGVTKDALKDIVNFSTEWRCERQERVSEARGDLVERGSIAKGMRKFLCSTAKFPDPSAKIRCSVEQGISHQAADSGAQSGAKARRRPALLRNSLFSSLFSGKVRRDRLATNCVVSQPVRFPDHISFSIDCDSIALSPPKPAEAVSAGGAMEGLRRV
ncbi:MAG: hypothetical protein IT539_18520 [Bradyrhizobiaceae bacterium]|nr:hypothetical protein [Bradyrhizobiaceae bacterium]